MVAFPNTVWKASRTALTFTSFVDATAISTSPPESREKIEKKKSSFNHPRTDHGNCLHINSFIWGSKVVIMVSTELLAFSATFARIPLPGIQPKRPPALGGFPSSLAHSSVLLGITGLVVVVGLSSTAISNADAPLNIGGSFSTSGDRGRRTGRLWL